MVRFVRISADAIYDCMSMYVFFRNLWQRLVYLITLPVVMVYTDWVSLTDTKQLTI